MARQWPDQPNEIRQFDNTTSTTTTFLCGSIPKPTGVLQRTFKVGENDKETLMQETKMYTNGTGESDRKEIQQKDDAREDDTKHTETPGDRPPPDHKFQYQPPTKYRARPAEKAIKQRRADWVRALLLTAGDVEENPGPVQKEKIDCGFCEIKIKEESGRHLTCSECGTHSHLQKKCSSTTKHQLDNMDLRQWKCKECKKKEEAEDQEEEAKECKECLLPLKSKHVRCSKCEEYCHLQRACSGVSRDHLKKLNLNRWLCQECKDPDRYARQRRQPTGEEHAEGVKTKCALCKGIIKAGARRMTCSKCKKDTHLQQKCSGETKEATKKGAMDTSKWFCPTCTEEEAERTARQNRGDNPVEEIEIISGGKTEKSQLRILQWNADSIAAKKEEFKQVIQENKIDIFVVQESKMTMQDKVPTIPGYTVLSKPRKQAKGKENVRGGGLLTGIKNTIPY